MWKEEKPWLRSAEKAQHKNGKGILKFRQRPEQPECFGKQLLCSVHKTQESEVQFCFSPLCWFSPQLWQVSQHLCSSFFLGSGRLIPASSGCRLPGGSCEGRIFLFCSNLFLCGNISWAWHCHLILIASAMTSRGSVALSRGSFGKVCPVWGEERPVLQLLRVTPRWSLMPGRSHCRTVTEKRAKRLQGGWSQCGQHPRFHCLGNEPVAQLVHLFFSL